MPYPDDSRRFGDMRMHIKVLFPSSFTDPELDGLYFFIVTF